MAIQSIPRLRPIDPPAVAAIAPPSLRKARDGPIRVVVWFRPELSLPDDEIVCAPPAVDALFGDGVAQRLLMTPDTAWLGRLVPREVAATLDATSADDDPGDVIRSTPFSHIYLLRLTGGPGAGHVCTLLGAGANVRLVYPEPELAASAVPTLYAANQVFTDHQKYLQKKQGVNIEPAWKKGHTGAGVQAGIIDTEASFSGLPYTVTVVTPLKRTPTPTAKAAPGSATVSTHARQTIGILGSPDHASFGIGTAPEVSLRFSPVLAVATAALEDVHHATLSLVQNGKLKAGDVVNVSLAVTAGLDGSRAYSEEADLLARAASLKVTPVAAKGAKAPSAVTTNVPFEFEPSLLKLVATLTKAGITVVQAAGNGLVVLCEPKVTGKPPTWVPLNLGANLDDRWLGGQRTATLAAFKSNLVTAVHSLNRAATATFADGGGIVVSGGQHSPSANAMISNVQLNHGNRVDCYVDTPNGQALGFAGTGSVHIGGSSLCAPVIAGVVAIVQSIAKAQFKGTLKPAVIRALLSDPAFGTTTTSGKPVGLMPNVEKLMDFLEKPQGKRDALLSAVQAQQQKSAARVKAAASTPGGFMHDPYTAFSGSKGSGHWQPLALAGDSDLFG